MGSLTLRIQVAAVSLAAASLACDGGTQLRRIVQDQTGRPLPGAIATLAAVDGRGNVRRADTALTQSNGFFELWLIHSPNRQRLLLQVDHTGYRPFRHQFVAGDTLAIPRPIVL